MAAHRDEDTVRAEIRALCRKRIAAGLRVEDSETSERIPLAEAPTRAEHTHYFKGLSVGILEAITTLTRRMRRNLVVLSPGDAVVAEFHGQSDAKLRDDDFCRGEKYARELYRLFHMMLTWDPHQLQFLHYFTLACAQLLYTEQYTANVNRLCELFGVDIIRAFAFVITPRRYGKTMAMAGFLAALALSRPGIRIAIFSASEKSGRWVLVAAHDMVNRLPSSVGKDRCCRSVLSHRAYCLRPLPVGMHMHGDAIKAYVEAATTSHIQVYGTSVDGRLSSAPLRPSARSPTPCRRPLLRLVSTAQTPRLCHRRSPPPLRRSARPIAGRSRPVNRRFERVFAYYTSNVQVK